MKRWFRFYEEAINDDKVRCLPSNDIRWYWVVLLTVASKYGGEIPSLVVAAENLRLSKSKAAEVIAIIARAGLLDPVKGGYFRAHNWQGRQPTDATAAERKRRQRQKERDAERDSYGVTIVTCHDQVTPLEIRDKIDDDDDARAKPLISSEANRLADEITKLAGHSLDFVPPSWCGAAYRAQQWLNQGWPEELIISSVKEQVARRRGRPVNSINYFESGIADHIARQTAPLPNVVEITAKTIEVTRHEKPATSGLAAIDRIFGFESGPRVFAPADENSVLSLPARSVPGA